MLPSSPPSPLPAGGRPNPWLELQLTHWSAALGLATPWHASRAAGGEQAASGGYLGVHVRAGDRGGGGAAADYARLAHAQAVQLGLPTVLFSADELVAYDGFAEATAQRRGGVAKVSDCLCGWQAVRSFPCCPPTQSNPIQSHLIESIYQAKLPTGATQSNQLAS